MSDIEMIEERLRHFVSAADDADWQEVLQRAGLPERGEQTVSGHARLPRRRLAAAVVVVVALAIPALAVSGVLGSLFGFSNRGTPVTGDDQAVVREVRMITGETPSSVVQLASRDGWTFYAAQTSNDVCYFDEAPSQSQTAPNPGGIAGGSCKNAAGEANFPSPPRPIFNMSSYFNNTYINRLAGVAADGVASVQVLALADCHVVATAPVIDNVYIADNLPTTTPESQIVARDAKGNVVWHQAVGAAIQPAPPSNSCGLG